MKNIFFTAITILSTSFTFGQLKKNVGDFNSLKVYDRIPVELIQSDTNSVEISGNLENQVDVVNKNGELKIKMNSLNLMLGNKVNVKVYYKSIYDIQASQGASIFSQDNLDMFILKITSNEGSSIKLDINSKKVDAKVNSGGEILLTGETEILTVTSLAGGKFLGKELLANKAELISNAVGFIEAYVKDEVEAKTRVGGSISIFGNPTFKKEKRLAGGTISYY